MKTTKVQNTSESNWSCVNKLKDIPVHRLENIVLNTNIIQGDL